jgi:hypothetical protein
MRFLDNKGGGVFRTWVERHVTKGGTVIFVPKQCNHCENAPCVKPCPTGATYKTRDGLVLVNAPFCQRPDAGGTRAGGAHGSAGWGPGRVGASGPLSWLIGAVGPELSGPGPGGK